MDLGTEDPGPGTHRTSCIWDLHIICSHINKCSAFFACLLIIMIMEIYSTYIPAVMIVFINSTYAIISMSMRQTVIHRNSFAYTSYNIYIVNC